MKSKIFEFEFGECIGAVHRGGFVMWGGAAFQIEAAGKEMAEAIAAARLERVRMINACITGRGVGCEVRPEFGAWGTLGGLFVHEEVGCLDAPMHMPCGSVHSGEWLGKVECRQTVEFRGGL